MMRYIECIFFVFLLMNQNVLAAEPVDPRADEACTAKKGRLKAECKPPNKALLETSKITKEQNPRRAPKAPRQSVVKDELPEYREDNF
jgi:hypothetical protein